MIFKMSFIELFTHLIKQYDVRTGISYRVASLLIKINIEMRSNAEIKIFKMRLTFGKINPIMFVF